MAFGGRGGGRGKPAANKKRKPRRNSDGPKVRGPKLPIEAIDWKDVATLQRFISAQGKMFSRKRAGLDAASQRKLTQAVKRARYMALLPFVS